MIQIPDIKFPEFPGVEQPTDPGGGSSGASLQDAQNIALLYEAGLNRQAELDGLNYWIDQFEAGMSLNAISQFFLGSPEFAAEFGAPNDLSNEDLVGVLYTNVLDRDGEAEGVNFWIGQLQSGSPRDQVLIQFAISPENVAGSPYIGTMVPDANGYWTF